VVDTNGVPGHSIWVITNGGAPADVAQAIYASRNAGCGMKGDQFYPITQIDSSIFTAWWDYSVEQNLYLRMDVTVLGGGTYDKDALKNFLQENYILGIYEPADVSTIITLIKGFNYQLVISSCDLSTDQVTWVDINLYPSAKKNQFVLNADNIILHEGDWSSSSSSKSSSSSCKSSSSSSQSV
jgi:hypothetical protein